MVYAVKGHEITRKYLDGYGDVQLVCSCGWKSRVVNMLGDNFAEHTLNRLKTEHLSNPTKR